MQLFRITSQIDYSSAMAAVDDPNSLANGSQRGATSVGMFRVKPLFGARQGVDSQLFSCFAGNFLLTIDMIVDMGGRPLVTPHGMDERVMSDREALVASANKLLAESGQD